LAAALSFAACDDDKAGQVADTASDVADTTDTTDATDSGADTELADTAPDVSDDSVGPDTEDVADTVDPDVISLEVIEVDATNYDAIEPPPLPQGVTDGQAWWSTRLPSTGSSSSGWARTRRASWPASAAAPVASPR
jgi:hypothetical protein